MRQPEDEKGNPTDNPTGDPTTKPTAFTDGGNYANYFVRELYLGFGWGAFSTQYDGLYLHHATLNGNSSAPLISIAPRKRMNGKLYYDIANSLTAMRCSTNGVVRLEGEGVFAGVEAYIVADWETVWALPASKTGKTDGSIFFETRIRTDYAQNLSNSPRIKKKLFADEVNAEYSKMSKAVPSDFSAGKLTVTTGTEEDATYWGNFISEIESKDDVTLVLQADIFMGKSSGKSSSEQSDEKNDSKDSHGSNSLYNIQNGKTVRIIGNGFSIFEYGYRHELVMRKCANGRKEADIQSDNIYNEAFTDMGGGIRPLAKSDVYEAVGWEERTGTDPNGTEYTEACGIRVPKNFRTKLKGGDFDGDNVYVWILVSWTRTLHKVSKYENGTIYFEKDSKNSLNRVIKKGNEEDIYDWNFRKYKEEENYPWRITAKPTFFLLNTTMDNDGIVIKDGKVSCPESYPELFRCEVQHIFNVEKGATLIIENTVLCGGKDSCIRNCGTLCMEECEVTNPLGKGVYTTGKAAVERCQFHDIRLDGVYQVAEDRERWKPDSPGEDWPRMSVTDNTFRNIGHYGLNSFAVKNDCVAYIAHNHIVDANYGGIWTGNNTSFIKEYKNDKGVEVYAQKGKAFLPAFMGLVEYNRIYFTDAWVERRKLLGFQDSGGIYVAPNNGRAVVRFNRVERWGGRHMNKAIYGDDGPYNAEVYCNIVSGTENDYDIDFRDMSAEPSSWQHTKILGTYVNTNNTISLNYCEGFVRIKDNNHDAIPAEERGQMICHFKDNAVLGVKGESDDPTAPTTNDIAYKEGNASEVATSDSDLACVLKDFIMKKINDDGRK